MNIKSVQKAESFRKTSEKETYNNEVSSPVKKNILGVAVSDVSQQDALEYVINFVKKSPKTGYVVTPNPEMIVASRQNVSFKNALNSANLALCDGVGLFRAGQILGKPLKSRIIGTNFVERLCEKVADQPITVGFLGGRQGVAEKAAECLRKKYPGLVVAFAGREEEFSLGLRGPVGRYPSSTSSGASLDAGAQREALISVTPNSSVKNSKLERRHSPDILFVAFGAPKQELWMAEHVGKIPVKMMIGVGGAFDQIVNPSLRAPSIINSIGMGWLYRLVRQPWRIKRQVALITFVKMVLQEKFLRWH